jgi:peroxin-5
MSVGGMYGTSMPIGMYGMNMHSNMYQGNYGFSSEQRQEKGKGKLKEADFEAAFAQAAASFTPAHAETPRIVEIDDNVTNVEDAPADTQAGEHSEFTE